MLVPIKTIKNDFNTFVSITEVYRLSQSKEVEKKAKEVNGGITKLATDNVSLLMEGWTDKNCELRLTYKVEK